MLRYGTGRSIHSIIHSFVMLFYLLASLASLFLGLLTWLVYFYDPYSTATVATSNDGTNNTPTTTLVFESKLPTTLGVMCKALLGNVGAFVDPSTLNLDSFHALPAIQLKNVTLEAEHTRRFGHCLRAGNDDDNTVPFTYVQATLETLAILLGCHPLNPLPLLPFPIHVRQQICQLVPLRPGMVLTLSVRVEALRIKLHRGVEVDIVGEAHDAATGGLVVRTVFTGLYRSSHRKKTAVATATAPKTKRKDFVADPADPPQEFVVPAAIGLTYAKVSGDWNPIHLPYFARLFGVKAPIVHGMWSLGHALGQIILRDRDGKNVGLGNETHHPIFVDVRWLKMMYMPSTAVQLSSMRQEKVHDEETRLHYPWNCFASNALLATKEFCVKNKKDEVLLVGSVSWQETKST